MSERPFRAVLFDMDGTLLHTAPDISAALNRTLVGNGYAVLELAQVAPLIGRGPRVLIERALRAHGENDLTRVDALFAEYVSYYAEQIGVRSDAFPDALLCLQQLKARGYRLGVVTNALQHAAEALLERFDLAAELDIVIGGDRVAECKPHPGHVLAACHALGVTARETLFVGDSANDVQAALGAGCAMVGVPHGYNEGLPPEALGCPLVASLAELPAYVDAQRQFVALD